MPVTEKNVREAMLTGQIGFAVQPILDARNGNAIGAEALSRWNGEGLESPSLDSQYLTQYCKLEWQEPYRSALLEQKISIADQLRRRGLTAFFNFVTETLLIDECWEFIQRRVTDNAAQFADVVIELSELSVFDISHAERAKSLDRLKHLRLLAPQLRFALDDFGSGLNNFDRLKTWDISILKLDKTLIRDIDRDTKTQSILRNLKSMACDLNVSLIAEGVETLEEESALIELGIYFQQGFFRAPPMAIEHLPSSA